MKRKELLRILGLVVALGLVSLTTVEAWPFDYYDYDNCYYACWDGKSHTTHQVWTTQSECCQAGGVYWPCPPGETNTGAIGWGGTYTPLNIC